jgi:hypothetical protein
MSDVDHGAELLEWLKQCWITQARAQSGMDAAEVYAMGEHAEALIARAEQAEAERDRAINEAHAAREARRMTEEALAVWKDRAERRGAWIRGHSGGEHSTFCASLGHHPTTCDCELHAALADEPPKVKP